MEINTAAELIKAVQNSMNPVPLNLGHSPDGGIDAVILPSHMALKSVKSLRDESRHVPERRTGEAVLTRLVSLIDHITRFKSESSAVFAHAAISGNQINAYIKAIYDYHPSGGDVSVAAALAHTAQYRFPISKDFAVWLKHNGEVMDQSAFALFLEERVIDMASFTAADTALVAGVAQKFAEPLEVLALSRDLEIYAQETVKQAVKLQSGEREVRFSTVHTDGSGKPVQIPDFFVIALPIFEGGESHRLLVRLRYRKKDERLVWGYDLYRIDRTLEEAFTDACDTVSALADVPVFFGCEEKACL